MFNKCPKLKLLTRLKSTLKVNRYTKYHKYLRYTLKCCCCLFAQLSIENSLKISSYAMKIFMP